MAYFAFLGLLALERLSELALSRRNARWALAQGGREFGRGHFRWMTLLHALLFVSCVAEVLSAQRSFYPPLGYGMLALALGAQALRYWAIISLGHFWNVRVIVIPGAEVVTSGPYRYLRHPNYLAVIVEGLTVPLIHSAWITAVVFTALNAWLLVVRIRCEEQALAALCGYGDRLGHRRRLVPHAAVRQAAK